MADRKVKSKKQLIRAAEIKEAEASNARFFKNVNWQSRSKKADAEAKALRASAAKAKKEPSLTDRIRAAAAERVEKRKKEQREKGKLKKPNLERDEDGILKAVSQGIDDANTDAKRKK